MFLQISITLEGFEIIFADVLLSIISLFLLNMASSTSEPTKITSILLSMHKSIIDWIKFSFSGFSIIENLSTLYSPAESNIMSVPNML